MTEKETRRRRARPQIRRRDPTGSTTRQKKSALRRAMRSLSSAGFTVGRKLVIAKSGQHVAVAFPNYIRAKRDHSRRPGEACLTDVFALVALHFAAAANLKG